MDKDKFYELGPKDLARLYKTKREQIDEFLNELQTPKPSSAASDVYKRQLRKSWNTYEKSIKNQWVSSVAFLQQNRA